MDNIDSRSSDLDVDLESGGTTSEEDGIRDPSLYEKHVNKLLGPEMLNLVDKKMVKDKRKKTSSTVPSKPPRPPRGPSLDAADIKLVREFSELAALKRKRVERMKSLRKRKAEKASSRNSSLFAMVVTILFCLVIIFQGLLGSRV